MTEQNTEPRAPQKVRSALIPGIISLVLTVVIFAFMLSNVGAGTQKTAVRISIPDIPEKFDARMGMTTLVPSAEASGAYIPAGPTEPAKQLNDSDIIAPVPNPGGYGEAATTADMEAFIAKASRLMNGQSMYFSPSRERMPGTAVKYYLDDSIAVVTWKELCGIAVMTFAEVKIADGSQFRRFLADGRYGADTQYTTTEMAQTVNAVLASSGDFYKYHYNGVVVYENSVRKVHSNRADTCFIDAGGNLIFLPQDRLMTQDEAQAFVDENNIRFSLVFGPILVENGMRCEPANYDLGEVNSFSPRAALCQMDELHYLIVTANPEPESPGRMDIHQFAQRVVETGCDKAYALDGGQTAAIALDGELVNYPLYGQQRPISDIIYFATSVGG